LDLDYCTYVAAAQQRLGAGRSTPAQHRMQTPVAGPATRFTLKFAK
jgi:hypothetical protein